MAIDKTSKIYGWDKMLRISDMAYPVYLSDFLKEHTNVSIGDFVWEYEFAEIWGYYLVHETPQPEGDVIIEGPPEYNEEEGLWFKTWTARDFTEEEIAENLVRAKEEFRFQADFQYSNETSAGITLGEDTFPVDSNELALLTATRELALAKPDSTILIRKVDNTVLELSAADALDKIGDIFATLAQANQNLLNYTRSVFAATSIETIPEIPSTFLGD